MDNPEQLTEAPPTQPKPARPRLPLRTRIIFFAVAWLIVLMPFLFWRSTWFGRALSDQEIAEYLRADDKPRRIQHALVQLAERAARGQSAERWKPELLRLAEHPVEEIRTTNAWLMGQIDAATDPDYQQALRAMLDDPSVVVRSNAALALVRYGDDSGRAHIVGMLQPAAVEAPQAGRVAAIARAGESIRRGTLLAQLESAGATVDIRAPIGGRVRGAEAATGSTVSAGQRLAVIEPDADQVWEALRALYLIGRAEDLDAVRPYARASRDYPEKVQQQAELTVRAIEQRAK